MMTMKKRWPVLIIMVSAALVSHLVLVVSVALLSQLFASLIN